MGRGRARSGFSDRVFSGTWTIRVTNRARSRLPLAEFRETCQWWGIGRGTGSRRRGYSDTGGSGCWMGIIPMRRRIITYPCLLMGEFREISRCRGNGEHSEQADRDGGAKYMNSRGTTMKPLVRLVWLALIFYAPLHGQAVATAPTTVFVVPPGFEPKLRALRSRYTTPGKERITLS